MKRLGLILTLALAVACGGDDNVEPLVCDGESQCTSSNQCDLGQACVNDCCGPFEGCTATSCDAGQFCDEDLTCKSVASKCESSEGCECHILNGAGQLPATGTPRIVLPTGASRTLQAILAVQLGSQLPGASFTFTSADSATASVSGQVVTAGAAGTTTVTADAGIPGVECEVTIVSLGAPTADKVRFYAFDEVTGADVSGVTFVFNAMTTGENEGNLTTATGIAEVDQRPGPFAVSAFADGYNYLTIAGLPANTTDVALPMSPRKDEPTTGGFTGKLSFDLFEKLNGDLRFIQAGIVASSFPLTALLNFSFDLFIGPLPDADCNATPTPAGCYDIAVGPLDGTFALPGGLVVGLYGDPIKESFDSVGLPGRRYAWALGTDVDTGDLSGILTLATGFLSGSCTCDSNPDVCDINNEGVACSCDLLCTNLGDALDGVIPLLGKFSSGAQGNLPLVDVPLEGSNSWFSYISTPYDDRADDDRFPKLDSGVGEYGKLGLREQFSNFTDYTTGSLPADPAGGNLEGLVVLRGVNAAGFGFVPLGVGVGADCTDGGGKCFDRAANPSSFDNTINGVQACFYDTNSTKNQCRGDVATATDQGILPDGHLGVYYANPNSGLEGQEFLTIGLALPISDLFASGGENIRATAFVDRTPPAPGPATLPSNFGEFTDFVSVSGRTVTLNAATSADVQWVTFASSVSGDEISTRWNVYFPQAGGAFVAPAVPNLGAGTEADPIAPAASGGDIPAGFVNATQVSFELSGSTTLTSLANNNGSNLGDLFNALEAFAIENRIVDVD